MHLALSGPDVAALTAASYMAVALLVLLLAKLALNLLTPFELDDQVSARDNPAFGVSLLGYYLGVLIVLVGAVYQGPSLEAPFLVNLGYRTGWALAGVALLNISRLVLDRVILRGFSTRAEIVEDRNLGVGALELGTYVASALVLAGALTGEGRAWYTVLALYGVGQVSLVGFALIYERLTWYDLHRELEADNAAAGVAYAGNLIAVGVLLMRGVAGDFVSWESRLDQFGAYLIAALALLTIGRFIVDRVLLPDCTLEEEITYDRNLSAGYLQGGVLLGLAALIAITT